ncbi:MAG: substrate-binding domain-containing protein [Chthoniobacterales bacterium]
MSTNQGDKISGTHPTVLLDDAGCGRLAAEHLLSLGFENFLTVGISNLPNSDVRIDAFKQTVASRAQEVRSILIGGRRSAGDPWRPLREALRVCAKPVAIFAPSDWSATHTMHCVIQEGCHIPEEVAILAAGNEELICENAPVPLSSIEVGHEQLARESALLLDDLLEGRKPPDPPKVIPNAGVVTRQSTEIIAVSDFPVAKALRFIWMNLDHTLPIQEICAHAGVPQKAMEIRFRNHLGRSIIAEINRARIEKAKTLLRTTDLKAKEIAKACGFTTPNYFNNVFHAATGHAPRKFRAIQRLESGNA